MKGFILFFLCLSVLAVAAGVVANAFREKPLGFLYKTKAERLAEAVERIQASETRATDEATEMLDFATMKKIAERGEAVILDARGDLFYQLGHIHGALSLPRDEFEKGYAAIKEILEADKNRLVVVYCADSRCEDAELVNDALKRLGYSRTAIYGGGWQEWEKEVKNAVPQ